jgi:2'-5' RNA ligase/predicted N-acetyltransferase YhbS
VPRLRLGVALLVPPPAATEVDVLRRACGDEALDRIAPHCTLVPPVNVREERLEEAVALLRRAAAATVPITVTLGPPESFLPATPVLYLSVSSGAEAVRELRDRVFAEPLARPLTWPFHPHVTLRDGGEPAALEAAVQALAAYRAEVTFPGVHLLQERRDDTGTRVWRPLADASFARPVVVGRGGLELELSVTEQLDPEAAAFSRREQVAPAGADRRARGLALTARRERRVVGTVVGWTGGEGAVLGELVVAAACRGEGIGSHLVAAFLSEAAARCGSVCRVQVGAGTGEGFWRRRGWVEEARFDRYSEQGEVVQLRRDL